MHTHGPSDDRTLASHSVQTAVNASWLLGISPKVAAILASFSLTNLTES
jgi:hypothetical protein